KPASPCLGRQSPNPHGEVLIMTRNWTAYAAYLGVALAVVALALLAISPLGWLEGWWHFRFAFSWLMPSSGYLGLAAVIVSFLVLAAGWRRLASLRLAMAAVARGGAAPVGYLPWRSSHPRNGTP